MAMLGRGGCGAPTEDLIRDKISRDSLLVMEKDLCGNGLSNIKSRIKSNVKDFERLAR